MTYTFLKTFSSNFVHILQLLNMYLNTFLFSFVLFFNLFIYLFLVALRLCCCVRAFSNCVEWGLLFAVVCRLLIAVASLVAEHGL